MPRIRALIKILSVLPQPLMCLRQATFWASWVGGWLSKMFLKVTNKEHEDTEVKFTLANNEVSENIHLIQNGMLTVFNASARCSIRLIESSDSCKASIPREFDNLPTEQFMSALLL